MKALYLALLAQIKTITAIKWIDLDWGQLDYQDSRTALKYPCALIRMNFTPGNVSEGSYQREGALVTVRLAIDAAGSRTNADAPATVQARSLAWADTADALYSSLQGQTLGGFEELECTSRYQDQRNDGLIVWNITFRTNRWLFNGN